eukprot:891451_1
MSNKPKIMIMDACRGNKDKTEEWPIENANKPKPKVMKGPLDAIHHPDEGFILVYPTTKGYQVPDDEEKGGNLIRVIADVFKKDANIKRYHLDQLLKLTQKKVKKLCDATQCMEIS